MVGSARPTSVVKCTMHNGSPIKLRAVCPHDCPDTCGLVVTVQDGKAIDLRGDKEHPFTRGFLCQKVARYLERVYHPGRLQYPMKRSGPKGSGQFTRVGWEQSDDCFRRG